MIAPGRLGMPTHPYAAYEIAWTAVALLVAFPIARRLGADGALSALALLLYALGRLALGQVREEGAWLLGLQQSQAISCVAIIACVPWIVYTVARRIETAGRTRSGRAPEAPMV